MSTYQETLDYLYALRNRGSNYGIDRMVRLVEALGHPEQKYPVIHVAGTNGKGSVCAMLEALYRESGYKTGLFTSPHLVHLGERAQVNRRILTDSDIVQYVDELRPAAEQLAHEDPELHPTFFEFMAAMAFLRFAAEAVDIALIETGLGGRLDATNVVEPELSIITSISFDHMEMLGDTLAKIASEKAGIIKPGRPVLIGCLPEEAEAVIRQVADERGCALYSVRERYQKSDLPETNLVGQFQRWNAGVALYATQLLADRFPVKATGALQKIDWPGRWQKLVIDNRTLILDATHNPEGAEALRDSLERLAETAGKPIIVAGTLGEERGRGLMDAVAPFASELFLVEPKQDRATPTAYLKACLPSDQNLRVHHANVPELFGCKSLGAALLDASCRAGADASSGESGAATIVVTGSIYLIGEVLDRLSGGGSGAGAGLQDKI